MVTFDISLVPFSRRGARMALSRLSARRAGELGKKPGLFLRTVAGGVAMNRREIFRLETLVGKKAVPTLETGSPEKLTLHHSAGTVEAAFADSERLLLHGRALGLRLSAEGGWYATLRPASRNLWELNLFAQRIQLMLTLRRGRIQVDAPWLKDACSHAIIELLPDETGRWEFEIQEFRAAWEPPTDVLSVEQAAASARAEFLAWLENSLAVPPKLTRANSLAAYINWSSLVAPRGLLTREAMLMSKNWMVNVWSWDHCFNAIALAKKQPALAWDQWALLFDHQHTSGMLPDCINDAEIVWNFTKPPVHGWALRQMRARGLQLSSKQMRLAVRWLTLWTNWWLRYRDDDQDGLPNYNHGNDSGWDNATVTDVGPPVEGADLAAFLIVQMDVLSGLCSELGQPHQAARWHWRANDLYHKLVTHSWREDRFVCPRSGSHEVAAGDSLVPYMTLILGERLDPAIRRALLRGVKRFVTPHGVATENPRSPLYEADGYWRGPVWAPSTYLIVSGLRATGENRLADCIAHAFCRTCAQSGFAENFDALTGEGLRDRTYTWTSSVFQILASQFSNNR